MYSSLKKRVISNQIQLRRLNLLVSLLLNLNNMNLTRIRNKKKSSKKMENSFHLLKRKSKRKKYNKRKRPLLKKKRRKKKLLLKRNKNRKLKMLKRLTLSSK